MRKRSTATHFSETNATDHPSFGEAFRFWLKLGFISFGGPTGQIAIMQTELVEKKKWISQSRFLHALNFCMLLPGPEAQQLAIYVGWLLHKTWGGIAAGALFVIPSMFVLWGLSFVYAAYGNIPWIGAVFYGLKPAVMAIVAFAVIRIGKKALKNSVMWTIAALAFIGIFFFKVPFPGIVFSAGLIGFIGGKLWKDKFYVLSGHGPEVGDNTVLSDEQDTPEHAKPSWTRALCVCVVCGLLWWAPILLVGIWRGWDHTLFKEGVFFSKAAMVTFGGAYAVLPYVAQQAVEKYGWLKPGQMMDGLGLAETTPGPLIMVLQFVGFIGAWHNPGGLSPIVAGTLGAFITTWATFVPCFLWIFLGAPHIEQLRGNLKLTTALSAVTAAVVGVVLNLAVWFGIHVLSRRENARLVRARAERRCFYRHAQMEMGRYPGSHRKRTSRSGLQGWPAPVILWKSHFPSIGTHVVAPISLRSRTAGTGRYVCFEPAQLTLTLCASDGSEGPQRNKRYEVFRC